MNCNRFVVDIQLVLSIILQSMATNKKNYYQEQINSIKNVLHDYKVNKLNEKPVVNPEFEITEEELAAKFKKARFKYNSASCKSAFLRIAGLGLLLILIAIIYSRFFNITTYVKLTLSSILSIYGIYVIIFTVKGFKSVDEVIRIIDRELGLKEKLITTVEFVRLKKKSKLYKSLINDAAASLENTNIKGALKRRVPRDTKAILIAVLVLAVAAVLIPKLNIDKIDIDPGKLRDYVISIFKPTQPPVLTPTITPEPEVAQKKETATQPVTPQVKPPVKQLEVAKKNNAVPETPAEKKKDNPKDLAVNKQAEEKKLKKDINNIIKRLQSKLSNPNKKTSQPDKSKSVSQNSNASSQDKNKSVSQNSNASSQDKKEGAAKSESSSDNQNSANSANSANSNNSTESKNIEKPDNNMLSQNKQNNGNNDQSPGKQPESSTSSRGTELNNTKGGYRPGYGRKKHNIRNLEKKETTTVEDETDKVNEDSANKENAKTGDKSDQIKPGEKLNSNDIQNDLSKLINNVDDKIVNYEEQNNEQKTSDANANTNKSTDNKIGKGDKINYDKGVDNIKEDMAEKSETDKLFSTDNEKLAGSKSKEFEMLVEGEKDETGGVLREAEFQGSKFIGKNNDIEKVVPGIAIDADAGVSSQQSQDDAIKNTQIPGEYEKIIKGMYIDN